MPPEENGMRPPRIKVTVEAADDGQAALFPVDPGELNLEGLRAMAPCHYLELEDDDRPDVTIQIVATANGVIRYFAGQTSDRAPLTDALATWLMVPLQRLAATVNVFPVLEVRSGLVGRHLLLEIPVSMITDPRTRQRLWKAIRDAVKGWWFDTPAGAEITGEPYEYQHGRLAREIGGDEGPYHRYT